VAARGEVDEPGGGDAADGISQAERGGQREGERGGRRQSEKGGPRQVKAGDAPQQPDRGAEAGGFARHRGPGGPGETEEGCPPSKQGELEGESAEGEGECVAMRAGDDDQRRYEAHHTTGQRKQGKDTHQRPGGAHLGPHEVEEQASAGEVKHAQARRHDGDDAEGFFRLPGERGLVLAPGGGQPGECAGRDGLNQEGREHEQAEAAGEPAHGFRAEEAADEDGVERVVGRDDKEREAEGSGLTEGLAGAARAGSRPSLAPRRAHKEPGDSGAEAAGEGVQRDEHGRARALGGGEPKDGKDEGYAGQFGADVAFE
jgi:hypothetical protein